MPSDTYDVDRFPGYSAYLSIEFIVSIYYMVYNELFDSVSKISSFRRCIGLNHDLLAENHSRRRHAL